LVVLAFIPVHIVANLGFGPNNGERLITAIIARRNASSGCSGDVAPDAATAVRHQNPTSGSSMKCRL
jgi:hypothetical protein